MVFKGNFFWKRSGFILLLLVGISLVSLVWMIASAQDEESLEAISATGLLTQATQGLSGEQYDLAIPYLEECLQRMKDIDYLSIIGATSPM